MGRVSCPLASCSPLSASSANQPCVPSLAGTQVKGTPTAHLVLRSPCPSRGSPEHSAPREEIGYLRASHTHSHTGLQCPPRPGFPFLPVSAPPELVQTGGWGLWAVRPRVGLAGRRAGGLGRLLLRRGWQSGLSLSFLFFLLTCVVSSWEDDQEEVLFPFRQGLRCS